ncbi:MAG: sodium:proton antiporter [Candidatus Endonucleobacter sp. (ex Gigantidas childressi)]|nr:sodium:proton antiporter [Candidatus Endonucleobacter sp. (ex Gigantidas childressi)]
MDTYALLSILSALALLAALVSSKISRLETTIAITLSALCLSLGILVLGKIFNASLYFNAIHELNELDFHSLLVNGLLGFLLFAGALNIRLGVLKQQRWEVFILALFSTLISTFLVAGLLWLIAPLLGINLVFIYCLLFGALISPTDPISVMAIINQLQAPKEIAIQVEGESLFNDGIGLVLFVSISQVAFSQTPLTLASVSWLFFQEVVGGIGFGLLLSIILHWLISLSDEESQKVLFTFLAPTAGYVIAVMIGVSAPLAIVCCGISLGAVTTLVHFDTDGRVRLKRFWFLIEEYFNSLLFLLIGFLLLLVEFHDADWQFMFLAIPLVLIARVLSVVLPYQFFRRFRSYNPFAEKILIWGGLRGGLALAMAMSIPSGIMLIPEQNIDLRELLMVMSYGVVMFSILVQGTTVKGLIEKSKAIQ